MAAHTPHRTFAPPLVVTLAAFPACQSSPPPTPPVASPAPPASVAGPAPDLHVNPGPPQPPPVPPGCAVDAHGAAAWSALHEHTPDRCTVWRVGVGTNVQCEPDAPHAEIACPADAPDTFQIVRAADDPTCALTFDEPRHIPTCPPGAHCNPGPPKHVKRPVDCPR